MSQIQLGSLDYDEIKNELKSFLSNQEYLPCPNTSSHN